jgi:murein tripeptide amidase MpaA
MRIETDFEGGRIEGTGDVEGGLARLSIPPDPKSPRFRQWFAFAATGGRGVRASFQIENAGACTWGKGFAGYRVFASEDTQKWRRIATAYDGKTLSFGQTLKSDRVTFAYFPPYPTSRSDALVERAVAFGAKARDLAVTARGGRVRLVSMGREDGTKGNGAPAIWVIAQQHPGEPMAGWFMEGFVGRLCEGDAEAKRLLAKASVFLVPRMNPDGCALANHRTNAAGIDLNRQWAKPSEDAPEVSGVRDAMATRGVDVFLDVHGDETIPYVFAQGTKGAPRRTPEQAAREKLFSTRMLVASSDFQDKHGYPDGGGANLAIASNYVADAYGALAMTLEMPYTRAGGAKGVEWTPERAARLGRAAVSALASYFEVEGGLPDGAFARR